MFTRYTVDTHPPCVLLCDPKFRLPNNAAIVQAISFEVQLYMTALVVIVC